VIPASARFPSKEHEAPHRAEDEPERGGAGGDGIPGTQRSGDTFTVQRGQEGTTALAWSASSGNDTLVDHRVTADTLYYLKDDFTQTPPDLSYSNPDFPALVDYKSALDFLLSLDPNALPDLSAIKGGPAGNFRELRKQLQSKTPAERKEEREIMQGMAAKKNPNAVVLGKLGGVARASSLTKAERSAIAKKAAAARNEKLSAAERTRIAKLAVKAREQKRKLSGKEN